MAYIEPTVSDFKVKFPSFANVSDEVVSIFLDEAIQFCGDWWLEKDRRNAQMYYCAHLLAVQGFSGKAIEIDTAGNISGAGEVSAKGIIRHKVGDVEVEFEDNTRSISSVSGVVGGDNGAQDLAATVYGQIFQRLLRLNFPPVAVV